MNITQDTLLDAIGALDGDLIDGYFIMRQRLIRKKSARRVAPRRIIAAIAACLAVVMLASYGFSYVPTEYNLEHLNKVVDSNERNIIKKNIWVYYVNDLGLINRERVKTSGLTNERFELWKYMNGIGNDVKLLDHVTTNNNINVYDENGKKIGETSVENMEYKLNLTVSKEIMNYENAQKLLRCLEKTMSSRMANYYEIKIILK